MRTRTIFTALALILGSGTAHADDEEQAPGAIKADSPLPRLELIDEDGDTRALTDVVNANAATVIVFFDPEQGPTFLGESAFEVPGLTTAVTRLHRRFVDQEVSWVFVALGETAAVGTACKTFEAARGVAREGALTKLDAARMAQFTAFRRTLASSGIEAYTLYATPLALAPGTHPTPCCAIVRGKRIVAHVAAAGDQGAIDALVPWLRLAVTDPEATLEAEETLPASTPRK